MDLPNIAQKIPREVVLIGNLDPVYILRNGNVSEVIEATSGLMKSMQIYPNFIFSFGCDCTPDTPYENLIATISTSQKQEFRYTPEPDKLIREFQ